MKRTITALILTLLTTLLLPGASQAVPQTQSGAYFSLSAEQPVFCGADISVVTIHLHDVAALYGYQFEVAYAPSLVTATGAFVNTFFDAGNPDLARSPWNADCASAPGICRFASSKVAPGEAVTGGGAIAAIAFTGLNMGEFDLTVRESHLSDRDGSPIAHTTAPLHLTVCGIAAVSGQIRLQGRATPIDPGHIKVTDLDGRFGEVATTFDVADGSYTVEAIRVMPGGSTYQIEASHSLYLSNRTSGVLTAGQYTGLDTRLRGGDANNNGVIDIQDLACIGGAFGGPAAACGETGSSDINADGVVNIFDLVLAGGNYPLGSPQPW